jgi:hypothetical protein
MLFQNRFDFSRFYPEPMQLHLVIHPTYEFQVPVIAPPHQIAATVQPPPRLST